MPESQAWSDDVYDIVVRMSLLHDAETISTLTGIPLRTVQRTLAWYEETGHATRPAGNHTLMGRPRILIFNNVLFVIGKVREQPDIFLDELREILFEEFGIRCSTSTIWRALSRCGFTMKKMSKQALERSEQKRYTFWMDIGLHYQPFQLVFVDESACDRRTTYRGRAWSMSGTQAFHHAVFVRGRRYSILPAMSLDGILHVEIVEGSFNKELFSDFIDGLLDTMTPFPGPNSVIIMDNCQIHKNPEVLQRIVERGMLYDFLPPYSPGFNPIESAFSAIKYDIHRHGALAREALVDDDVLEAKLFLMESVYTVTAADAAGWFRMCGYV